MVILFFQIARIFYYFSDRPEHFERRYGDCTLLSLESNRTPKCQRCRTTTVRNSFTESGEAFVEDMMAGIPVEEHTSATPEGENGHSFQLIRPQIIYQILWKVRQYLLCHNRTRTAPSITILHINFLWRCNRQRSEILEYRRIQRVYLGNDRWKTRFPVSLPISNYEVQSKQHKRISSFPPKNARNKWQFQLPVIAMATVR